jgi:hypothetical protein
MEGFKMYGKVDNEVVIKRINAQHNANMPYGPEREDYDTDEDYMLALDDFQDFLEYMYDDMRYESYFNNPYVIATEGM